MDPQQAWQAALGELQLQLTRATFETWVKNTFVLGYEDSTFVIGAHNAYAKDWLENRLMTTIKRTLIGIVGRTVDVRFVVRPKVQDRMPPDDTLLAGITEEPDDVPEPVRQHQARLNPRYTFNAFIVGSSNRLANAAAIAVAENPGKAYNPLFIYGGVGLGKTHLMQAIGNQAQERGERVLYVSSETFTNDLINSIRSHNTEEFRIKYRNNIDVLIIDDIQFFGGKESTQEEMFHTFNTLYEAGKQIIISSDRPPAAIVTLEERLRSRFEWGLIVDIQPPDLETRIAILRAKAEMQSIPVPTEVIDLVAHRIHSNIRELEGSLNRIVALAQLMNIKLEVEVAASALDNMLARPASVTDEQVLTMVCSHFNIEPALLKGRRRSQNVALPRQVAMYLLREELHYSLPQIGRLLGGRDHTTILYGCQKIASSIEEDDQLRRDVLTIKERMYGDGVRERH